LATSRVLIISQHPFPEFATQSRNVAELLRAGIEVDLICTAAGPQRPDDRAALRIFALRLEHRRTSATRYMFEYLMFFFWSIVHGLVLSIRHRYAAVVVDNPQDFLVFATVVARIRGARVVLEMMELTPELAAARLGLARDHPLIQGLAWIERLAIALVDHVIAVSEPCREILTQRGVGSDKISVITNTIPTVPIAPDVALIQQRPAFLITHSSLIERYGVDVAIHAFGALSQAWPELTFRVLGEGHQRPALMQMARQFGLEDRVIFRGFVPYPLALTEIQQATVGIVAVIKDGYGELILPTKLLDYVQSDVAVVCARLPAIRHYFPDDALSYFEPGDATGLALQVDRLLRHPREAREQAERASRAMRPLSWQVMAPQYMAALRLNAQRARSRDGLTEELVQ
jgi:glycosyltransferase involved in cell wall biosynthesis